jgi:AcrR family transcriptional regulator
VAEARPGRRPAPPARGEPQAGGAGGPAGRRRSHAERTAATRARILAAVVDCIAEGGLAGATAVEIERRAGVTWGAVQHHFGGKDGLLLAVLEDSFRRFAERIADVPVEGTTPGERARLFVERAWAHFRSREYRSTFEILRGHAWRGRPGSDWRERMFRAWDREWRRLFDASPIPRRHHLVLQHYTVSVLSGLASTLLLEGETARPREGELELLVDSLARALAG